MLQMDYMKIQFVWQIHVALQLCMNLTLVSQKNLSG